MVRAKGKWAFWTEASHGHGAGSKQGFPAGGTGRPWVKGAHWSLARALMAFADMADPDFRKRLVREVGIELRLPGPLPVPDNSMMADHVNDIVSACGQHDDPAGALRALVQVLEFLRPHTAAFSWLNCCVSGVLEQGVVSPAQTLELWNLLRDFDPLPDVVTVQRLVYSCCSPTEFTPVREGDGLADALRRLNLARVGPGTTPLMLRFLDALADHHGGAQGAALSALVRDNRRELGLVPSASRGNGSVRSPLEGQSMVLQILLEEGSAEGLADDRCYTWEALLFEASGQEWDLVTKYATTDPVTLEDLRRHRGSPLSMWRDLAAASACAEDFRVEFLLPWSLLDHAAELWPIDEEQYPLGLHCPVVLRSLDRLKTPQWHRAWRTKWRSLQHTVDSAEPVAASDLLGWFAPPRARTPLDAEIAGQTLRVGGSGGQVRKWLDHRSTIAGLALAVPYTYRAGLQDLVHLAVKEAVREGIPVIIWRRDGGSVEELQSFVRELPARRLPELAGHVYRRRRAADEYDAGDMGNHISLLWDDPNTGGWSMGEALRAPVRGPDSSSSVMTREQEVVR